MFAGRPRGLGNADGQGDAHIAGPIVTPAYCLSPRSYLELPVVRLSHHHRDTLEKIFARPSSEREWAALRVPHRPRKTPWPASARG